MVLNRRIANTNVTPTSKIKFHQRMMEINVSTGRRWNGVSGVPTHRESVIGIPTSSVRLPTASQPATHQRTHRIIEENNTWKSRVIDQNTKSNTSNNCLLPNFNIVKSRRQLLSRVGGDCGSALAINDNSIKDQISGSSLRRYNKNLGYDCQLVNGRNEIATSCVRDKKFVSSNNNWERNEEIDRWDLRTRHCGISKSSSVPANLKEGLRFNASGKVPIDGILKKSSVLVDKSINKKLDDDNCTTLSKKTNKLTTNRRGHGISANLRKSPSCQTLNINLDRNSSNNSWISPAKKSVSFSLDTSFVEKRTSLIKKTATIHEAKVYRKGVLRDVHDVVASKKKLSDLSLSINNETMMSQSLLKAARDADDLALTDLVARMRRSSLNHYIDVNATDSSGRSAISYIAGNGADEMLEILLSLSGINPNLPDNEGNTPLHFAAQAGQAESLNILLQRRAGIELDVRNVLGFTPLMKAALQGRTKCAKILLFAGANPTLRDYGKGLKAEQWARFCGRHACADIIERFSRHKIMEKTSCRWGSEPELATKVLQGKLTPMPLTVTPVQSTGFKSKIKRVFRSSTADKSFSLVSQLTNAALCASTPALPKPGDIAPVKSLIRPLIVPQLKVTLVAPADVLDKHDVNYCENDSNTAVKPSRVKKKNK